MATVDVKELNIRDVTARKWSYTSATETELRRLLDWRAVISTNTVSFHLSLSDSETLLLLWI